jgi:hypothetical protein
VSNPEQSGSSALFALRREDARRCLRHGSTDPSVGSTEDAARPSARALAASTCFRPRRYRRIPIGLQINVSTAKINNDSTMPRPSLGQRLKADCPADAASATLQAHPESLHGRRCSDTVLA